MPVQVELHTVPHFKAPVNAKLELWGLEYGGTFAIQTSVLKVGCLKHKSGFVGTEVVGTVNVLKQRRNLKHTEKYINQLTLCLDFFYSSYLNIHNLIIP